MSSRRSTTTVRQEYLGICPDGSAAESFTLVSGTLQAKILSYGARFTSLLAPGRDGIVADVVLGYADWRDYLTDTKFLGCTAGRFANRIAAGTFTLDGTPFYLSTNNGRNTLHGGTNGFFSRNWQSTVVENGIKLVLRSPAGDQGFPGEVTAEVTYTLEDASLHIDYRATTDAPTVINLTNHAYFNLAGEGTASILDHQLQVEADLYLPTDAEGIPLGPLAPVSQTPFDFTRAHALGEHMEADHPQLRAGMGYDHTFVIRGEPASLRSAASVTHPGSGRRLAIETTEPGMQFYSGNHLDGTGTGASGRAYGRRSAFCLETQHFPDSPNRPEYPSTVLRPGETFQSATRLHFSAV